MDSSNRTRWRHRRNTIPARRRRRRSHRRDSKRGGTYYPMEVDPQSAMRGVRSRLVGAVTAASVTLICVLYAMLSSMGSFGATFALTVGICSFGAAVALLLSARHEEEVHELAFQFDKLPVDPMASAPLEDAQAIEDSADDSRPGDRRRALPAPDPLEGFDREGFDRTEHPALQTTKRADFSGHTDGAL